MLVNLDSHWSPAQAESKRDDRDDEIFHTLQGLREMARRPCFCSTWKPTPSRLGLTLPSMWRQMPGTPLEPGHLTCLEAYAAT